MTIATTSSTSLGHAPSDHTRSRSSLHSFDRPQPRNSQGGARDNPKDEAYKEPEHDDDDVNQYVWHATQA